MVSNLTNSSIHQIEWRTTPEIHPEVSLVVGPIASVNSCCQEVLFKKDYLDAILDFSDPQDVIRMIRVSKGTLVPSRERILRRSIVNLNIRDCAILPRDWENFRKAGSVVTSKKIPTEEPVVRPLPIPKEMREEMMKDCPHYRGKIIAQTHILLFEPDLVNGKPVTWKRFKSLMAHPTRGHILSFKYISGSVEKALGDIPLKAVGQSGYKLITREILPGSGMKTYQDQLALVAKGGGSPCSFLEMAVLIAIFYNKTGQTLYHHTFTRCQDVIKEGRVIVGEHLLDEGLSILSTGHNVAEFHFDGIASCRNLS